MSGASDIPPPQPPVASAAAARVEEPPIPDVPIPHMGTSQVGTPQSQTPPQPQAPPARPQTPTVALPTLPEGVTQEAVDAAIRQVEQTGTADGLAPQVLAAACQQIEAHAQAQGIDLAGQSAPGHDAVQGGATPPSNYVEAAVMDKQSTFDNFHQQRDQLKSAVTEQREAAQKPYQDALAKTHGADGDVPAPDLETVKALADALRDLDPETISLINALGVLSDAPGVLKSIVWLEIVRAMRALIANEAKHQLDERIPPGAA